MLKMNNAIELYQKHLVKENKSERTITTHISTIRRFADWCNLEYIEEIMPNTISEYVEWINMSGAGYKSIQTYFSCLRSFFNYFEEGEYISRPVSRWCKTPKREDLQNILGVREEHYKSDFRDGVGKYISGKHWKKILASAYKAQTKHKLLNCTYGQRNAIMLAMGMLCGLSLYETIILKTENIDLENRVINLIGKRNLERTVPITDEWLINLLKEYMSNSALLPDDCLFPTDAGRQMVAATFADIFKEILIKAHLPSGRKNDGYVLDDLRGSYITNLFDKGIDAKTTIQNIGVDSPATAKAQYRQITR